jgi:hypothetical protein
VHQERPGGKIVVVDLYQVLLLLHLLCFVYWLGGDLGVYYSSGILIKPGLTKEARTYVRKVMHWLDQFPRVCMPLVIALGFSMGSMRWFDLNSMWLWIIWAVALVWIYIVLTLFLNTGGPEKTAWIRRVDLPMRWVIAIAITVIGIMSLMGTGVTQDNWLATKMLIWAGTVFCGIASRYTMKPFGPAFGRVMNQGETPEDLAQMKRALYITRIPIFSIWGLVAIAGAIGLWQPF